VTDQVTGARNLQRGNKSLHGFLDGNVEGAAECGQHRPTRNPPLLELLNHRAIHLQPEARDVRPHLMCDLLKRSATTL
jgi:hypothetical protein